MAIAHKSPKLNHCALEQLSRCLQTTSMFETLFTFRHPYKCAPPNSSSLLLRIIKSLELSERRYQISKTHHESFLASLSTFHIPTPPYTTTMPPFYPYTPATNTTLPCTHHITNTTTISAIAAQATTPAAQNSAGTSLSTADIIGITVGVLILFLGLAWFAYHALAVMPARKKAVLREKRARKNGAEV
jgi:hypothetical protein